MTPTEVRYFETPYTAEGYESVTAYLHAVVVSEGDDHDESAMRPVDVEAFETAELAHAHAERVATEGGFDYDRGTGYGSNLEGDDDDEQ